MLVALGLAFTAVGVVEYRTRTLLLNPKVISSNQLESYFRVNSLFFDPNIFGRFLVVVMLGVAAVMVWARQRRVVAGCVVVLAVLWGGLVLSLSQSSLSALLVGLLVLGGLRWSVKVAAAIGTCAVVIGLAIVLVTPGAIGVKNTSLDRATSGRVDLVEGGIRLLRERPVAGWGSGGFSVEYRRAERATSAQAVSASHTIPITVGAEQGAIGLAIYLALLAAAFWRLLRGASRSPVRAAVGAMFVALVFHTLLYAAFLEDPLAWALLAAGSALAAAAGARPRAGHRIRRSPQGLTHPRRRDRPRRPARPVLAQPASSTTQSGPVPAPSGTVIPSARSRRQSTLSIRSAVCASAQARTSLARRRAGATLGAQRIDPGLDIVRPDDRRRIGQHAGQHRRHRPAAEARGLEDPVGDAGVVERVRP